MSRTNRDLISPRAGPPTLSYNRDQQSVEGKRRDEEGKEVSRLTQHSQDFCCTTSVITDWYYEGCLECILEGG